MKSPGSTFIAVRPLSQTPEAIRARELRLHEDPKAIKRAEHNRRYASLKIDKSIRRMNSSKSWADVIHIPRWNEIARLHAAGRSIERIAIYLNMPEWIVKILVHHIAMTNAGQGTAAQNLEEANRVIKATNMRVQR